MTLTEVVDRSKPAPPALTFKRAESKPLRLLLSDVYAPLEWNARSRANTETTVHKEEISFDPETQSTGLGGGNRKTEPGLIELLLAQGQLDPAETRPNTGKGPDKEITPPHILVTGFRRFTALSRIAKSAVKAAKKEPDFFPILTDPTWDARAPTILVLERPFSALEARIRNLNENTSHDGLSVPDLAFGVRELIHEAKLEGRKLTGEEIAGMIGKSGTVVSQLLTVMRLPKSIREHWRHGGAATFGGIQVVTTKPMALFAIYKLACDCRDESEEVKEREYGRLLAEGQKKKSDEKGKSVEDKKFGTAVKKARWIGEIFGYAAHVIPDVKEISQAEWELIVADCVQFKRLSGAGPTEAQIRRLVDAARDEYADEQKRLSAPEDGEESEDEEENEKRRSKRDGGR